MPFIAVGQENTKDIKIYFEDHGSGEALLMIHGYPFSGAAWEKQVLFFLEKGYRVITYDRRGFGNSSRPATGYDYETFSADLHALIEHLELTDLTLVGHSMGSGEVVRYLSKYGSQKVKCAVLVSPIPPFLLKTPENKTGVEKKVFEGFEAAIKKDRYAFITEFLKNFYNLGILSHGVSEEKLRADFNLASSSAPVAFFKCVDTWLTDFRHDLPRIDVPLMVIHGDKDQILPIDATSKLIPGYVNADLRVISGGSHGIPWTHAEEICEMILQFISSEKTLTRHEGDSLAQLQ
ncbi:MAG TPA: alpha/beta hydrolase [Bacteriovoracaceae bacterium]|nr:alpha/beta hydrolase [Bacteriovoracaceae bacterium]